MLCAGPLADVVGVHASSQRPTHQFHHHGKAVALVASCNKQVAMRNYLIDGLSIVGSQSTALFGRNSQVSHGNRSHPVHTLHHYRRGSLSTVFSSDLKKCEYSLFHSYQSLPFHQAALGHLRPALCEDREFPVKNQMSPVDVSNIARVDY